MLAYQQISHHFAKKSPASNDSRENRSISPNEMIYNNNNNRKEALGYVKHERRSSLSRSTSPVRSHSPTYMSHIKSSSSSSSENFLIKRSMSEEDLRTSDRRRISLEQIEHQQAITHRPQILINYHSQNTDDGDSDSENAKNQCDEHDEEAPLDLSMGSKKRRGRSDSATDSDDSTSDSTGMGEEGRGNEGRAYKKSLMKRYCEFLSFLFFLHNIYVFHHLARMEAEFF
jgi:hypothetical protein